MTAPTPLRRPPRALAWLLLALGTVGFAAAWVLLSVATGRTHGWMAVAGALDLAWMLRLGRWPAGPARIALGVTGTLAIIALANWWTAASQLGLAMGLAPWDSAERLGGHHAWLLAQLANGTPDLAWLTAALVVAAVTSR